MMTDAKTEVLFDQALLEEKRYWNQRLSEGLDTSNLILDRQRPDFYNPARSTVAFSFGRQTSLELNRLTANSPFLLYTTLMAALKVCLWRYTGSRRIAVGSPSRVAKGGESNGGGSAANIVVIVDDIDRGMSFQQLLLRVRQTLLDAYEKQTYPFQRLLKDLGLDHVQNRCPLFDVGLVLDGIHRAMPEVKNDITIVLNNDGDELRGEMRYREGLFLREGIGRFTEHFVNLLSAGASNPKSLIGELVLSGKQEHDSLLFEWNATTRDYPKNKCIHELFEEQAERRRDAVAVVQGDTAISYGELNSKSNRLAHHLRRLGVNSEMLVGLYMERSAEMVVGMLGILKAGGGYVPLDPAYPAERLEFISEDAAADVIVTRQEESSRLSNLKARVIVVDEVGGDITSESESNPESGVNGDNLAYVIYTSGSTGQPKGVAVPHRAVNRLILNTNYVDIDEESKIAQASSATFDAATFEFWGALLKGGRLVMLEERVPTVEMLRRAIEEEDVNMMWLTATLFNVVVDEEIGALSGLKQLLVGGEALSVKHIRKAKEELKGTRLINGYGPTEGTTFTCTYEIREVEEQVRSIPIGQPISNTTVYVLDERQQLLPVGAVGELYIGGDGLARGYVDRADETGAQFVPAMYGGEKGARLYRTGDLVRRVSDGSIEYLGRRDYQVKLRGFRIELAEIESAALEQPAVKHAAVVLKEDGAGKRLVGYAVPEEGTGLTPAEIRDYLKGRLPEYMVPLDWAIVPEMPLTAGGKIDRQKLLETEIERAEEFAPARNETEEILAGIWSEVLKIDRVGINDDFFGLGGHSLLAAQVVARIRKAFSVEMRVRQIFECTTIAGLAQAVDQAMRSGHRTAPPINPADRSRGLPLSYPQQRLWFLNEYEPDSSAYNIGIAVRLKGALDLQAIELSLAAIVKRHESLRTAFVTTAGGPVQIIKRVEKFILPRIDLSNLFEGEREGTARQIATDELKRPFNLGEGQVFRAVLFALGSAEYGLLVAMHHIVSDGWSLAILMDEFSELYRAYRRSAAPKLRELPVQYGDYAYWQRELIRGELLEEQLAYWTCQLSGAPALLELPSDRPRLAVQRFNGSIEYFMIRQDLSEQVKRLSRQYGATLFMTLLAAYELLLSRYSRQLDITVGTSVANRRLPEVEGLIGFFVNTLVMRGDLGGDPDFRELLRRVKETALAAYTHQDIPFERLVEAMDPDRDMSHTPLFQVVFVLQNTPVGTLDLEGVEMSPLGMGRAAAIFDITMSLTEVSNGLAITAEYSTDLFDRATISRMLGHYCRLLESVVAAPERKVKLLTMLTDQEVKQFVEEWNPPQGLFAARNCLHELFEQQALNRPDAIAIVDHEARMSYSELNRRTNRTAAYLQRFGAGRDGLVGIYLDRGIEMVIGIIAIMKTGSAYVPLDPTYPKERLALILDDADVRAVLTVSGMREKLPAGSRPVVCMDEHRRDSHESEVNPVSGASADNLAYVMFTSGSTGKPKGVLLTHANVICLFEGTRHWFHFDEEDIWTLFHSYGFDLSVWELWGALIYGGQVVIVPYFVSREPQAFYELLIRHRATVLTQTPSAFRQLIAVDQTSDVYDQVGLRWVVFGGEALEFQTLRPWFSRHGDRRPVLVNMYGITETTIHSTYREVTAADLDAGKGSVIGVPVRDLQIYILDRHMNLCPIGVPGEIFVGGEGLARGYLQRPELSAERFVPDPPSREAGARLYRSGDLARYLADGEIEYVGRMDFQVKVRGFRVELGEIEAALTSHAAVREAVILVREDSLDDKRLVAYVTLTPDSNREEVTDKELRRYLGRRLPDYMLPSAFVLLDKLPLTPNGKIDRRALPATEATQRIWRMPRTPYEEILCELFADVLGVARVGLDDNFFELGGHSLLAALLVGRIRLTFGVEVAVRGVFEGPTVGQLAGLLNEAQTARPAVRRMARPAEIPLSFAQKRLWFLNHIEGPSATYNIPLAMRLGGKIDAVALELALKDVVERHESLRTIFPESLGIPRQGILDMSTARFRLAARASSQATVMRDLLDAAQRGFDLSGEIPIRALLFELSASDHILLLVIHHIAGDGWSLGPLIRDLSTAYAARCEGKSSEWPELPVQYADYTLWQREVLGRENDPDSPISRQLAYWKETLRDLPEQLDLPMDRPRPVESSYRGGSVSYRLPEGVHSRLSAVASEANASLFMVMQAGIAALLTRLGAGYDIPIGSPIAGRTDSALEELIGFFVNMLVLRNDTSREPTFNELVRRVRSCNLNAYAHQDLPFERLVEELNPPRSLARHPLFQVLMIFQNMPKGRLEMAHLAVESLAVGTSVVKFDLAFTVHEERSADGSPEGLYGVIEYASDLFDRDTVESVARRIERLFEGVSLDAEQRIGQIALLTPEERRQILEVWNAAGSAAAEGTLIALFEASVDRASDNTALVFQDLSVSYGELNRRANELARLLMRAGIGPEDLVGVALPRSAELIVCLLAILKAGAAYLPLDPEDPAERLAFMVEDATPICAITLGDSGERLPQSLKQFRLDEHDTSTSLSCWRTPDPIYERPRTLCSENPAYVIYTSGSTGTPKGVTISHQNVVRLFAATQPWFSFGPADVWTLFHSYAFDFSVWELWGSLLHGGRLVVVPKAITRSPAEFLHLLIEQQVTVLNQTPSAFYQLVQTEEENGGARGLQLRLTIFGGEALDFSRLERWYQRHQDNEPVLVNMYGITETTVHVSHFALNQRIAQEAGGSLIGTNIPDLRLYVLEPNLELVPARVAGELFVGGAGLARGYLKRAGLTAERFVADPYGAPGTRMYRTGDLVRRRTDGTLEFLGRADQQVKIRGFRVELGEIEAALLREADVSRAVAVLREDRIGEKRLVGYVVAARETAPDTADLRRRLAAVLPEYMVPAAIVLLKEIPLTANGKIDRRRLPAPEFKTREWRTARTREEQIISRLFGEVLGLQRVGIEDNFFEVGGDSILSIQLVSRAMKEGLKITPRQVFQHQTVERIAAAATAVEEAPEPAEWMSEGLKPKQSAGREAGGLTQSDVPMVNLSQAEIEAIEQRFPLLEDILPLTRLQKGLLFHALYDELAPDVYTVQIVIGLAGPIDEERLARAARALVARHASLRAGFIQGLGEPVQIILKQVDVPWATIDLTALGADERRRNLEEEWLAEDRKRRFDVEQPPLVRFTLIRLGSEAHRLVITNHHLLADGWSTAVLLEELPASYELGGDAGVLPAVTPYSEYLRWIASQDEQEARLAWEAELAGLDEGTRLAKADATSRFVAPEDMWFELSEQLTEQLTRIAQKHALTLNTIVEMAWGVLLGRMTGRDDVTFGIIVSGRQGEIAGIDRMVGLFINTLPLRIQLNPAERVSDALARLQERQFELMAHQHIELAEIQRIAGLGELFDTLMVFENFPVNWGAIEERQAGMRISRVNVHDAGHYPLILFAIPGPRMRLRLSYRSNAFDLGTVEVVKRRLERALETITAGTEQRIGEIDLLEPAERRRLLEGFNATEYPVQETTIVNLYERTAEESPDAIAVVFDEQSLTYRELDTQSNRLSHLLIERGVGLEETVAVALPRSLELMIGLMGILKAGAAYLPLDTDYPLERISFILNEAQAGCVLTFSGLASVIPEDVPSLVLDDPTIKSELQRRPGSRVARVIDPDNRSYVIYTSGSTGQPKGVLVRHGAVVNRLEWMQGLYGLGREDRVLQKTPSSFDVSVWEFFWPLIEGAALVIAKPEGHRDPEYLVSLMSNECVTTAHFVPSMLEIFLQQEDVGRCTVLRRLICSGEALSPELVNKTHEKMGIAVHNLYGPTEATVDVTFWDSKPEEKVDVVPIGRPIWNTQAYVLDSNLQPVAAGVKGELYIAGVQLARGYLKRAELTAERFIASPYGPAGSRMYRTGDVVSWRKDGNIEFFGRADQQVKIRGLRVELGEIEAELMRQQGVARAVVVMREDSPGEKRLVGYVVADEGSKLRGEDLRREISRTVPDYLVPAAIVALEAMPLTANGKIDRKKLLAPEFKGAEWRSPRSDKERTLSRLFEEVLRVARVGLDDNFFQLGGDSIMSMQLVSRMRKCGLKITPRQVFQHQTVEKIAAIAVEIEQSTSDGDDAVGQAPATPIMRWLEERGGDIGRFSQTMMLDVPSALTEESLATALQAVIDRHDSLRLRLVRGEKWSFEIEPAARVDARTCVRRVDVSGLDGQTRLACEQHESREAVNRLSPEKGVMLQAVWFDRGEELGRLLLAIHHLAVDGVSWRILAPELQSAWKAIVAAKRIDLGRKGTSYYRWASRLKEEAESASRRAEMPFWREMLCEPAISVSEKLDPERDTIGSARNLTLTLPAATTTRLMTSVVSAFHCGINDVLLTGLALSVMKWARERGERRSRGVLLELEGHGREEILSGVDLTRTVGWFTSLYPVRLELPAEKLDEMWAGGKPLGKALKTVKEQLRKLRDQGVGYGLLRYLNDETGQELAKLESPSIGFNYLGRFGGDRGSGSTEWTGRMGGGADARMPLAHSLEINAITYEESEGPELTAFWTWAPALIKDEDANQLAKQWFEILEVLAEHAEEREAGGLTPSDVPLVSLSQEEIELLESGAGELEDILPLTALHEGLLFHVLYEAEGLDVYMVQIRVMLEGQLDERILEQSANLLAKRHESLRAGFVQEGLRQPVQIIVKEVEVPWRKVDLSGLEQEEQKAQLNEWIENDRYQRFDFDRPPLLRFMLIKLGAEKYMLVMTNHHILVDGWSIPVLLEELLAVYERRGDVNGLPRIARYREYLEWSVRRDVDAAKQAWEAELEGLEEGTRLTEAKSSASVPEAMWFELPEDLSGRLTFQARTQALTLNTIIELAWGVLLGRMTWRNDVVFGITAADRAGEIRAIERMVGLFMNTFPLRVLLNPSDRVTDTLMELQERTAGMMAHQHLALTEIQRIAGLGELFDTLLLFQNYPVNWEAIQQEQRGLRVTGINSRDAAHYPLILNVVPGRRVLLRLTYRPDVIDLDTVHRIRKQFEQVLKQISSDTEIRIGEIRLLSHEEEREVIDRWNDTGSEYRREESIHRIFEITAAANSDAVAVEMGGKLISYGELNRRSNQLGHYLKTRGVGDEVLVGLCMDRGIELIVAILAILKAGGGYLPLDPDYPVDRLAYMIDDAGLAVIVSGDEQSEKLPAGSVQVINIDSESDEITRESEHEPGSCVKGENIAYVMYTSGSTGAPKGVQVLHRGVVRLVDQIEYAALSDDEILLQASAVTFDASTFEIWGALLKGGRLVLMEERVPTVSSLKRTVHETGVTTMWLTATLFNAVVDEGIEALMGLKQLLVGGEALSVKHIRTAKERLKGTRIINGYGPTEGTTFTCTYEVGELREDTSSIPIGRAIANTRIYVLDQCQQIAAQQTVGELYIAGDGLGRGYLKRGSETAERFVPDKFSDYQGTRMYQTGDLVRFGVDGTIEYLGRRDHQVKIRGYRIELGEIEAAVRAHPAVKQAAVVVKDQKGLGKRLAGYVTAERERNVSGSELREFLKERLPDYMAPMEWILIEEMPLTRSGKVDRRKLQLVDEEEAERAAEAQSDKTPTEAMLSDIWAQVLNVESVRKEDDFFELGGHSLLAMVMMSRLEERFKIKVQIRSIFENTTLMEFSRVVDQEIRESVGIEIPPIRRVPRNIELPVSFAQERLWFIDQLVEGSEAHIIPLAIRLRGEINEAALETSLNDIVQRHEVLRTRYELTGARAVQVIEEEVEIGLGVIDLREIGEAERQREVRRIAQEQGTVRFDLARVPLIRTALIRAGIEETVLLVVMHHIVTDGWSLGILNDELGKLYRRHSSGEAVELPELEVQYADYAVWQREWLTGETLEREIDYWRGALNGAAGVLELPADYQRPMIQRFKSGREMFALSEKLSAGLNELSRREGVTLYMALLAGFEVLLYRYSGQRGISVGSPISNRGRRELEKLIGFFINMLALRVEVRGEESYHELVKQVRDVALGAYAHQDMPFEQLVDELQPERSLSYPPLVQVTMTLENAPMEELSLGDVKVSRMVVDSGTVEYDLSIIMAEGDIIAGAAVYNADLFERETIRRMIRQFEDVLEQIVADAGVTVDSIRLLSQSEEKEIIARWKGTEREYRGDLSIQELFESQVDARRDSVAVKKGSEELTYEELSRRSNQLANYLRRIGVEIEVPVGLCVERSIEMVIGMLGILKAGGAYVPLDPEFPVERLEYMIEDAGIGVIVSRGEESEKLPAGGLRVVDLNADREEIEAEDERKTESGASGDNAAYVMYTSGSTGKPKGIDVLHRGVVRLVDEVEYVELGEREVVLQASTATFDASTFEIWGALLKGGRSVMPEARVPTVEGLRSAIEQEGLTTMWLTATLFNAVVDEDVSALRGLKQLLVGGEALSVKHVRRAQEELKGTRLVNGYGPTEGTTFTCTYQIEEVEEGARSIPIGRPISNTSVYVLDERRQVVPVGVVGELYIGGDGLGRGYLRRADQTAEKFMPERYSDQAGTRMYRTGDLVRYSQNGTIEYVGRTDHQVKVRGYRIELGEIEEVVLRHGGIKQAAVVVKDEGLAKRLVGYVLLEEGVELETGELRDYLKTRLPEYMVPGEWVKLEELPLTVGGKIDRIRLRELKGERLGGERVEFVEPRTRDEWVMVEIWKEVLGVDRVGIRDNYFELGGDSIRSIQVLSRARQRGLNFKIQDLFLHATIEELVSRAERVSENRDEVERYSLISEEDRKRVPEGVEDAYPLSQLQAGMLFHSELAPDTAVYHDIISYDLLMKFDLAAMRRAVEGLIRRHELLRTSFDLTSYSEAIQLVHRKVSDPIDVEDISRSEADWQEDEVEQWIEEEKKRPLDWKNAPMMRIKIHIKSDERFQLSISFHHAILDGWSFMTMLTELLQEYSTALSGEIEQIEEPEVKYREYVAMEKAAMQNEECRKYWREKLKGSRIVKLPRLSEAGERERVRSARRKEIVISGAVFQGVNEVARKLDVPLKSVLLASQVKVHSVLTGETEVMTGVVANGRPEQKDAERMLGLFLNSLPFRVELKGGSWAELIKEVFDVEREMLAYRRYPLAELQKQMGGEELFDVLFIFLNFHMTHGSKVIQAGAIAGHHDVTVTTYPLVTTFIVDAESTSLALDLLYDETILDEEQIEEITSYYVRTLELMVADIGGRYEYEDLLSVTEKIEMFGISCRSE